MKYIIVIISSIILSVFSLKEIIPKLCINCKFFTNSVNIDNKYGKCSFFPIVENSVEYFVTGIDKEDYFYCTTARDHDILCGRNGKMYVDKAP